MNGGKDSDVGEYNGEGTGKVRQWQRWQQQSWYWGGIELMVE